MFQRRKPIFQRVSKLLKVSFLRRPFISRLKFPRKPRRSTKRVKLLQQYNYRFLQEYQFSPSSTSLIRHRGKCIPISRRGLRRIYRLLFFSWCLGRSYEEGIVDTVRQSWIDLEPVNCVHGVASPLRELPQPYDCFSEDDSIDLKAEKFIEKFYNEMRMQARGFS